MLERNPASLPLDSQPYNRPHISLLRMVLAIGNGEFQVEKNKAKPYNNRKNLLLARPCQSCSYFLLQSHHKTRAVYFKSMSCGLTVHAHTFGSQGQHQHLYEETAQCLDGLAVWSCSGFCLPAFGGNQYRLVCALLCIASHHFANWSFGPVQEIWIPKADLQKSHPFLCHLPHTADTHPRPDWPFPESQPKLRHLPLTQLTVLPSFRLPLFLLRDLQPLPPLLPSQTINLPIPQSLPLVQEVSIRLRLLEKRMIIYI